MTHCLPIKICKSIKEIEGTWGEVYGRVEALLDMMFSVTPEEKNIKYGKTVYDCPVN